MQNLFQKSLSVGILSLILAVSLLASCVTSDLPMGPVARKVSAGDIEGVRAALDSGTSPNMIDSQSNFSLLAIAIRDKQFEMMRFLVKRGARAKGDHRASLYMLGTGEDVWKYLLKEGGLDPDEALSIVITSNDFKLVDFLLKSGAKLETPTNHTYVNYQETKLNAVILHALWWFEYIQKQTEPDVIKSFHTNAMIHTSMARHLLRRGANPNARTTDGVPALILAMMTPDTELVSALLKAGAKIESQDKAGRAAFHWLVISPQKTSEVSQVLLTHLKQRSQTSPGLLARVLNQPDQQGWTPLHFAADKNNQALFSALVSAGANPSLTNKKGQSATQLLAETRKANEDLRLARIEAARQAQAQAEQNARQQAELEQQEEANSFQWGKFAALATGAAIAGVGDLAVEDQAQVLTAITQDSLPGQSGVQNSQRLATEAQSQSAGSSSTPQGGPGALTEEQKKAAKNCANQYKGPDTDPQVDSHCKLAAFDACLHRVTGLSTYDQEGRAACKTLEGLLQSTNSKGYNCPYCPYPY